MEISELILTVVTIQMPCFNTSGFLFVCLFWFNEFIVLTQNFIVLTFVSGLCFYFPLQSLYCRTIDGKCSM